MRPGALAPAPAFAGVVCDSEYLNEGMEQRHHSTRAQDVGQRAAVKAGEAVPSLVSELVDQRGMARSDVASLAGVSVSAMRQWRKIGKAAPESRMKLARLASFLDVLEECAIEDPAQWIEVPLPLPTGYTVRPFDLYREGHVAGLLDVAAGRRDIEDVLTEIDRDWQESRRSPFEVYDARDGQKAIRFRVDLHEVFTRK